MSFSLKYADDSVLAGEEEGLLNSFWWKLTFQIKGGELACPPGDWSGGTSLKCDSFVRGALFALQTVVVLLVQGQVVAITGILVATPGFR